MSMKSDLTRWNRAGLARFRYIDGNAVTFLEDLRKSLRERFSQWEQVAGSLSDQSETEKLARLETQYSENTGEWAWEIARVFARSCHILTEYIDACANEGYLGTATQWDNIRRMVEMLDYHPAPPASAATTLSILARDGKSGLLEKGFQVKHAPEDGTAPIIFETLEDIRLDSELNGIRPSEYDRNPKALTGKLLVLEEDAIDDITIGQPLVLEDERSGKLLAYFVTGARKKGETTELDITPRLSHRIKKGYAIVHIKPEESLAPLSPAASAATIDRVLRLTEKTDKLLPGMTVFITDGLKQYYRRLTDVRGKVLVLGQPLGPLNLKSATVGFPVELSVSRQGGRDPATGDVIRVLKVPGDLSRLVNQKIGDLCTNSSTGKKTVVGMDVISAVYTPADTDHVDAGFTTLRVSRSSALSCEFDNPQSILAPPVSAGPFEVDTFLEKRHGHLPPDMETEKPKKISAGDLCVVATGNQASWCRLASVSVDMKQKTDILSAENQWQDRGGGDYFLTETAVYGHFKKSLRVSGWTENKTAVTGNTIYVDQVPQSLQKGRRVLVQSEDRTLAVLDTTVKKVGENSIQLSRDLPSGYTRDNLVIAANVARAGHGKSQPEVVLGSGDATRSNQSFILEKEGVSFVSDPTQPSGVRADIQLTVGERTWTQVGSFSASESADPHYTVRMTEQGHVKIGFGDGRHARRLPTGSNNVRAAFRKGVGLSGNLPPQSLTKPVKPHRLVDKVRQPMETVGGNDMESADSLRENAPATVLTLQRAVSLSDYGYLAAGQSSVWQARAFSLLPGAGRNERIEVVVVPAGGGTLGPLQSSLKQFLEANSLPGVDIAVSLYQSETFDLDVRITVLDGHDPEKVVEEVKAALETRFSLENRKLGQDLYLSEVYHVVETVTGVSHGYVVINQVAAIKRVKAQKRQLLTLGNCTVGSDETLTGQQQSLSIAEPPDIEFEVKPAPVSAVGQRPVRFIQGVGPEYAKILSGKGIKTLGALSCGAMEKQDLKIGTSKLCEFKSKADIITRFDADKLIKSAGLDPLMNFTVSRLLKITPAEFVSLTGKSPAFHQEFHSRLRMLQMAMDDSALNIITLKELL